MAYQIKPEKAAPKITKKLLCWYEENKRDLPWRNTRDPYCIWVCEIMAQQTRISFLLDYYKRFIQSFPTVKALADAEEADVLKAWEGLGYYSRAKNLHSAAKRVISDFGGVVPKTKEELLSLPGIGEYTAGAILSIAYDIGAPAVDGNVLRVFSRLENSDQDIRLSQTRKNAEEFVLSLMPKKDVHCFTQALMELGALVCIPKTPACAVCPVQAQCKAFDYGNQNLLPNKSAEKPFKTQNKTILIIRNPKGEILMRQRTERLLSGLWEFYMVDGQMSESDIWGHLQNIGHHEADIKPLGLSKHRFTHILWLMQGYDCISQHNTLPEGYMWLSESEISKRTLPAAIRYYTGKI